MKRLHRFAILLAASTFVLVLLGAIVSSTGSGLAVPYWPATFVSGIDSATAPGAALQQAHRVVAALVGLLTLIVAVLAWRDDRRDWMKGLAVGAFAAVVAQATYGGIGVVNLLPPYFAVLHAALAQAFLAVTVALALFTSPAWLAGDEAAHSAASRPDRTLQRWAVAATAAIYLQIVIGAAMRHSYTLEGRPASFAIPDYPLAFGQLVPLGALASWAVAVGFAHRVLALVAVALVVGTAVRVFRRHLSDDLLVGPAGLLGLVLLAEVGLGGLAVLSAGQPVVTATHAGVVAVALVAAVLLTLRAFHPLPAVRAVVADSSQAEPGARE